MDYTVKHGERYGEIKIPASKSYAHRILIAAALGKTECTVICDGISKDIEATANCLSKLCADVKIEEKDGAGVITVMPGKKTGEASDGYIMLPANESGSTLRFLTPVVGALSKKAAFIMEGKLSERPMTELTDELKRHGMSFRKEGNILYCDGTLSAGDYTIPGNISSQYVTGLLYALSILPGKSTLTVTGKTESTDYIIMTERVISDFGVFFEKKDGVYTFFEGTTYKSPKSVSVESDWSNAAFFACMGAMSKKGIVLKGMNRASCQGDKRILDILADFGAVIEDTPDGVRVKRGRLSGIVADAKEIPDLVPTISAVAAVSKGVTTIVNAQRLKLKESDRLETTTNMLSSLGAFVTKTEDGLIIKGKEKLSGNAVDAANDHRIAMAAAVAACASESDVTVLGAECVAKSYPEFWKDFESLFW